MSRLISRCSVSPETSSAMEGQLFPEYQYDTREIEPAFFCFLSRAPLTLGRDKVHPRLRKSGRARSSSPSARSSDPPSAPPGSMQLGTPWPLSPALGSGHVGHSTQSTRGRRGRGRVASVRLPPHHACGGPGAGLNARCLGPNQAQLLCCLFLQKRPSCPRPRAF